MHVPVPRPGPGSVVVVVVVVVALSTVLLPACPPRPEECARNIERPAGGEGEGEGEGDGAPVPPPPLQCFDDSDCFSDQFCDFSTNTCRFFDAECFVNGDCGRDFVCDPSGQCVPAGGGGEGEGEGEDGVVRVKCFLASDGTYDCDCDDFASFRSPDFCLLDEFKQTAIDECEL